MSDKICVFGNPVYAGTSWEIIATKKGQYIYLTKKDDDKKEYRYNIANGEFERINHYKTREDKISHVEVQNITGWFTDCSIFCTDEKFARVMIANKYHFNSCHYFSGVRFIEALNSNFARNYEGWLSLGIKITDIEERIDDCIKKEKQYYYTERYRPRFNVILNSHPKDCEKNVLNYIKDNYTEIDSKQLDDISSIKNMDILMKMHELSKSYKYADLFEYKWRDFNVYHRAYENHHGNIFDLNTKLDWTGLRIKNNILSAIEDFNLNIESFCEFILRAYNVEGLTIKDLFGSSHYNDFLRMDKALKYGKMTKVTKYPRQFLTQFHILKREYTAFKKQYDQSIFKMECDRFRWLEEEYENYRIVVPEKIEEIENEADELSHCVRTYIDSVIEGKTLICFLRTNENPKEPLVTIEVKQGFVTQAYGVQDSKPSDEAIEVMRKWAQEKCLRLSWAWN